MTRMVNQDKISHDANYSPEDEALLEILRREMRKRKDITQSEFAAILGITPSYLTEILNRKKSGQRKAMQFFIALGIADKLTEDKPDESSCPINCDKDMRELSNKVKQVIDCKYSYSASLRQNIDSFYEAVEEKIVREESRIKYKKKVAILEDKIHTISMELENFKATHSPGPQSGTIEEPAKRTGSRKKAG